MAVADFDEANFTDASLQGATFCHAYLRRANFARACLKAADLFDADLRGASFYKTNLEGTNLYGANLEGAKVGKAELQQALVDENVSKAVIIDRTVVPPWGVEENKIPFFPGWFYRQFKSPAWLSGLLKAFMVPISITLITILVTHSFDAISQQRQAEQANYTLQLQAKQTALGMKNDLVVRMSSTVSSALTELELIQYDEESKDINVALKNYLDGYRNLLVNGSEIEAELSSYFPNQSCADMSNYMQKGKEGYNNIVTVWDNYYRVVLQNFYDLQSTTDVSRRNDDISQMKYVFNTYGIESYRFVIDQRPVQWYNIIQTYPIKAYNDSSALVEIGVPGDDFDWNNLEQIIDGYKSIIEQCVLQSNISVLQVTPVQ